MVGCVEEEDLFFVLDFLVCGVVWIWNLLWVENRKSRFNIMKSEASRVHCGSIVPECVAAFPQCGVIMTDM